jgi:hypothetical protein
VAAFSARTYQAMSSEQTEMLGDILERAPHAGGDLVYRQFAVRQAPQDQQAAGVAY